jgi:hypothetical protein
LPVQLFYCLLVLIAGLSVLISEKLAESFDIRLGDCNWRRALRFLELRLRAFGGFFPSSLSGLGGFS